MRKLDSFFLMILLVVAGLSAVFYGAYTLDAFSGQPDLKARLERQKSVISLLNRLETLKKERELIGQRQIASLPPEPQDPLLNLGPSQLAEKFYLEAKTACYQDKQDENCIADIDKIITHFPETAWAGEALVLLTDYYYRTKRLSEAREIVKILKYDFKNNAAIQQKVKIIEKVIL